MLSVVLADCCVCFIFILSMVMLSVVLLNAVLPSVIILNANVLSADMLIVVAPQNVMVRYHTPNKAYLTLPQATLL